MPDYRNATSSWSGYSHQGKVGLMLALREICGLLENNECNFDGWLVEYESAEDIDIKRSSTVVSRHQIKAYADGNTLNDYKDVLKIQEPKLDAYGKYKNTTEGFQIRSFNEEGNALEIEVDENSRFLHTICEVSGFYLSKEDYENRYPTRKYIENGNKIKLYKYPDGKEFCNISDDSGKKFCISFIKKILEIKKHIFKENNQQHKYIYLELLEVLDTKIHTKHISGGYPAISFNEILEIILDTSEHAKQNASILRSIFVMKFEEFISDRICCGIPYADTAMENVSEKVKEIYKLTDEKFFRFLCELNPEKKITSFSSIEDIIDICKTDDLKNMFFDCLIEVQKEDFIVRECSYMRDGGYLLTLITDPQPLVNKTVHNIITNQNLTRGVFEKKYMINKEISNLEWESHIGRLSDENEFNHELKSNWKALKVDKKFYDPELTFMSYAKAKEILKGDCDE
ncbi:MAG: ABC-three component system protein [Pleomorphochaeta sp.]